MGQGITREMAMVMLVRTSGCADAGMKLRVEIGCLTRLPQWRACLLKKTIQCSLHPGKLGSVPNNRHRR